MRVNTFFRTLRIIAAVTLFFFAWSFLPLYSLVAYAAEAQGQGTRGQGPGARVQEAGNQGPGAGVQGSGGSADRFEKALDAIRENVSRAGEKAAKGEDDTRERDAIKAKRAEIDSADGEFKKEFSATEKKLKDAKLPKEILDRHAKFVKNYTANLKELRANLDGVEQAKTSSERQTNIEKARLHLERVKTPSRHKKIDTNNLPFKVRDAEKTREPRLKQDEFEKAFPSRKKIRTALNLQDLLAADSRRSTQILDSGFKSAVSRKPILVASNGSLAGLLPSGINLPRTAGDKLPLPSVGEGWGEGAIPNWEVQLAQAQDIPTSADLAETTEIQFTTAILAKAQELGGNPVRIYEYVRNNIEFTPTYGSIQGADGCLETKKCNAYDTSSLLIALLRASNISSRYVYGTIEVPTDRFMDWAGGFTDIQSAIRFVSSSGTPIAPVIVGNVISKVQLEHPWVEAWIDYNPSRGERHVTGDTWIPLDASYKQHTSKDGVDIAASVSLDNQAFLQALGAGTTADETTGSVLGGTCAASGQLMENYRILAGNYLSQQHPNSSAGDVMGGSAIRSQEFPYLLGTLPYRVYTTGIKSSEMPDSLRNSISLRLLDAGIASIDITRSLPELAAKQISIGFVSATQADQDTILRYLPQGSGTIDLASLPSSLPAYLINVKPELRINGTAVATGAPINLGKAMTLEMTFTTPGLGADSATRSINAGDYAVIMLETGSTAAERLSSLKASIDDTKAKLQSGATAYVREDVVGNLLRAAGLAYSAELSVKRGILERSFNVRSMMQPSILLASSTLDTTQVFGLPHTARGKGIGLDRIRDNAAAASRSGNLAAEKQFNITASLDASGLTSRVLDDLLGSSSLTGAVRALQTAKEAGISIHTINHANIASVLPLLSLDAETLSDIQNAVNAGLTVVTTRMSIAISNKIVTPLVLIDPLDGKSAWLLENGLNGSMSVPGWSIQSPMMNLAWSAILPRLAPLSQSYLSDNFAANFEAAVNGVAFFNDSVAGSSLGLLTQGIFYSAASTDLGCYLASTSAAPFGSCMASFSGSLCMADAVTSLGTANARPLADAGADRTVAVNSLVTLDGGNSSDQNNDALTYAWTMTAKPAGSSAALSSGSSISPTFSADLPGSYVVSLVVSDGKNFSAPSQVSITAAHPSVPTPNLSGKTQAEAEALIIASHLSVGATSDAVSDAVSPGSVMSQDPPAGAVVVKGSPVKMILSSGPSVDREKPVLSVSFDRTPSVYTAGETATLYIDAKDDKSAIDVTITVDGGMSRTITGPTATMDTTGFAPGSIHTAVVTATDQSSNSAILSLTIGIMDPDKTTGPVAEITSPALDAEISAPTQIIGSIQSQNLLQYTLSYAAKGTTTFTTFAEGTATVTNGILGTLDPTLLKNGLYDIRLAAVDTNGRKYWIDTIYRVTGDMKVGNFTVTFTDMSIPVADLPVTVSRTYDSRDKTLRDFGIGWSVDIQNVKIDENRTPGDGWPQAKSGGPFGQYCITGDTEHYVSVNLPDGRSEEFDLTLTPNCQWLAPVQQTTVSFTPRPGTTSALRLKDSKLLLVANGQLLDPDTISPYDPQGYILTDKDGMVYDIDQTFGIKSATDPNGNTITYSKNGVNHSAGTGVTFVRDGKGRIAQVKGPDSSMVSYGYNSKDELVSVTDQNGNITTYTYNRSHGLTGIKDPRGITPVKNEYDSSGRLVAHTDSYGKRIEYTHDIAGRQEVVKDRNGNLTVFIYDEKGRVLQKTDPMGSTTGFTYDSVGNKLSETDALGNTTIWTYDAKKNVLSESKIISGQTSTTRHTYNSLGKVLTTTDPLGHVTSNTYDVKGNLLTMTDALGNTTTNTYDAKGNVKTTTDALSNTTTYEYDGYGNRTKQTTAAGAITHWIYDAKGNKLSETDPRGNTTLYSYDASGKLISTENAIGAITRTDYDKAGNKVAETNPLGLITWFYYDSANRLVTTEYPDGTTTKTLYDNEGNRIASIDQEGRSTAYEYNGSKQLKKTIYADQTTRQFGYDEAGRQTTVTDALGNVTTKVYDVLGRVIANIDPELNSTTFEYDANGNQITQTDANGHTTIFAYDENSRQVTITLPGGQVTTIGYDALGRKASETDAAGYTTEFGYDVSGNLNKVTDAEGGITRYEYDLNNNRTAIVDARGNRTTFAYDGLNRMINKTMPNGGIEIYAYDHSGRQITKTDAKSQTIQYGYYENGRLATRSYPDGSIVSFSYTDTGKRLSVTDGRGITTYAYDSMNRLKTNTYPDGNAINYGYDATGKLATLSSSLTGTVTYGYYTSGRLKEVTDSQGKVTSYNYDAAGSRFGMAYPNGTTASYVYDVNNRLTNLAHKNALSEVIASYVYTLGAIGNRERIDESSGISRQYAYDRLYRLKQDKVTDPNNTQTYQNDFTYDTVGNRQNKTYAAYNQPTVSNDYTYNNTDQLLTENGVTYTYDLNGNLAVKTDSTGTTTYVYNYDDRLVEVRMPNAATVTCWYDADNNRVSVTTAAGTTKYLVDANRGLAQILAEYAPAGNLLASYVYADDLLSVARGGQNYYYHFDGLGSTRILTDGSGAVTDAYHYDAFGNLIARTGTTVNDFLFTGQQYDANIGYYYLRARLYQPDTGRFTGLDPFAGDPSTPMSLHKYLYASNNPVNFIDPTGLFADIGSMSAAMSIRSTLANIQSLTGFKFIDLAQNSATDQMISSFTTDLLWLTAPFMIGAVIKNASWAAKSFIGSYFNKVEELGRSFEKVFKEGRMVTKINNSEFLLDADRFTHIITRHTVDYFKGATAQVPGKNTVFPPGTTVKQILLRLKEAVRLTEGKSGTVTLGEGITVRISYQGKKITQFYPLEDPAHNIYQLEYWMP